MTTKKAPDELHWHESAGGAGGPHKLLVAGAGLYVGHFYVDASEGVDVDAALAMMAAAPRMLEALRLVDAYLYATAPESNERQIVQRAVAAAEAQP